MNTIHFLLTPGHFTSRHLRRFVTQNHNFLGIVVGTFNKLLEQELMKGAAGIDVQMIGHPMVEGLAGMSDQGRYWEFDIPALMINDTSFIRNPNYHEMSDDIDTLSFDHMKEVVTCAHQAITGF